MINYMIYSEQQPELDNCRILITGDSHIQLGLNPDLFSSAQNISQLSEPSVISFWKLKKIFNSYIPDTVIIGLSPHNLSSEFNNMFSNYMSDEMFRRIYTIQDLKGIEDIISINFHSYYKVLWKNTSFYPHYNHINYIGSFYTNKTSDNSKWRNDVERHFYGEEKKELAISVLAINYLDSIVNLCDKNKVQLVLVSTPVFKKYYQNIPSKFMIVFHSLLDKYEHTTSIVNGLGEPYSDSLFMNSDHLNTYGANRFTNEVIDLLRKVN